MFSKEDRKKQITVMQPITHSLDTWLDMELDEVCGIFDIHVRTNKQLKNIGIKKLYNLFNYSKNQLLKGKELNGKIGKVAMKEIEEMLSKLDLKLS
jgi:hypothetical protein